MMVIKRGVVCILLMFVALTFFACQLPTLPDLSCRGVITFNDLGLEGVSIKSDVKDFAKTNSEGEFSFSTKSKTITIFPVLEGYMFQPKQAVLSEGENVANFTAIKIEPLKGEMVLRKVIITPTSIASSPDNYVFNSQGKECLKASNIVLSYQDSSFTLNNGAMYLYKNQKNVFDFADNQIKFECGKEQRLGILVNAYFSKYYQEWETTDTEQTYLDIWSPQTNADLIDGKIEYNLFAINNKSRAFTLDITFVFDYECA